MLPVRVRVGRGKAIATDVKNAVEVLTSGGLVVYPTESSYALGANATDEKAILRLYEAKGRDPSNPIPVIVADLKMWRKYAFINRQALILVAAFMPGPLTIALRKKRLIPDILNPHAIAARIPSHPVAQRLVRIAGFPITSTSANISGEPPARSIQGLSERLMRSIDLILDTGNLAERKPSTIVDLTDVKTPKIVREGPISGKQVLTLLARG
jgi:L-threonylcarbamoyladenylate synthase